MHRDVRVALHPRDEPFHMSGDIFAVRAKSQAKRVPAELFVAFDQMNWDAAVGQVQGRCQARQPPTDDKSGARWLKRG